MLQRRHLLAMGAIAPLPTRPQLSVGPTDSLRREATLSLPGGGNFRVPTRRARLVAVFHLRAMEVAAVAFAADTGHAAQDLLALIAPDATLLALERLAWVEEGDRCALTTRAAMLPDRTHLTLIRTGARIRGKPQHEAWTDYLRAEDGALHDRPPRPVAEGTMQADLAAERQYLARLLPAACRSIEPSMLQDRAQRPFV